ncbi:MAG: hypothetical protein Q8922_08935 [Bacteroidota bacterium]|nr:hypothetical protein [Bacteroidota bacterium]MDP4234312.1 hypothetical protein [Bacteroidota bacterium]MDP4243246.1 hypothetical protein [Bacteroidota bacterium]MDP4288047.1 hypothetical protein [Bacteroidota bacterium]
MKKVVVLSVLFLLPAVSSFGQSSDFMQRDSRWMFGLGYQLSGSNLFLLSWQSPDQNHYGRSWRIEPMIGGGYSDNLSSYYSISSSLTLGLGAYLRWRVRAPFDDLYFQMGPRVSVTGNRSTSSGDFSSQYLTTSLSFLLGPEYEIDKWQQHMSIAGFLSLGGSIRGWAKESPSDYSPSSWSFNLATGTGIVVRYYFE